MAAVPGTPHFKTNQIVTSIIVASGASGNSSRLMIVDSTSMSGTSGAVNSLSFLTTSVGNDVFLYVSGSKNTRGNSSNGVTVLAGDVVISGTLYPVGTINGYTSGSTISNHSGTHIPGGNDFIVPYDTFAVRARLPANSNYLGIGTFDNFGWSVSPAGVVTFNQRCYKRHLSADGNNGTAIGGYNGNSSTNILQCSTAMSWTAYFFFKVDSVSNIRLINKISNSTSVDTVAGGNNSVAIRFRPDTGDSGFVFMTVDNAGLTSSQGMGVSLVASTSYVAKITWDGTNAGGSIATLQSGGNVGTFSTAIHITSSLPDSTLGLSPSCGAWVDGAPGFSQQWYVGGVEGWFAST